MPDGRLLFSSDRGGDGFRIFVTDVATRATWRLEDTGANASSPEPSRDGQSLVFVGYTADGYDLFSMPLASARWTPVEAGALDSPDSSGDARLVRRPHRRPRRRFQVLLPAADDCAPFLDADDRVRRRRARGRRRDRCRPMRSDATPTRPKLAGRRGAGGPTGSWPTRTTAGGRRSSPTSPTTPIRGETATCERSRATPACCFRSAASGGRSRCSAAFTRPSTRSRARHVDAHGDGARGAARAARRVAGECVAQLRLLDQPRAWMERRGHHRADA